MVMLPVHGCDTCFTLSIGQPHVMARLWGNHTRGIGYVTLVSALSRTESAFKLYASRKQGDPNLGVYLKYIIYCHNLKLEENVTNQPLNCIPSIASETPQTIDWAFSAQTYFSKMEPIYIEELVIAIVLRATVTQLIGRQERYKLSFAQFDTLRPRQNGRHFADEYVWIPIKISLKIVSKCLINNNPALVQIMAWRRPGDKPLSETIMVSLQTHSVSMS